MILHSTTFSFDEVLQMRPGDGHQVSRELIDQAWRQWISKDRATYNKYSLFAYATIEVTKLGYTVTTQYPEGEEE